MSGGCCAHGDSIVVTGFGAGVAADGNPSAALRSPMVDLAMLAHSVRRVACRVAAAHPNCSGGVADFIEEATGSLIATYGREAAVDDDLFRRLFAFREATA